LNPLEKDKITTNPTQHNLQAERFTETTLRNNRIALKPFAVVVLDPELTPPSEPLEPVKERRSRDTSSVAKPKGATSSFCEPQDVNVVEHR